MAEVNLLSKELEFRQHQVLAAIDKIAACLKSNDPMLEVHCKEVHKALQEQEELVHILPDSEISKLMAGMQKWKNVQLVAEATKSRGKRKVTADDL